MKTQKTLNAVDTSNKTLFVIKDQDDTQQIVFTDYYKWLVDNNLPDVHNLNTKLRYLKENGFDREIHFLGVDAFSTLRAIECTYVTNVLVPVWNAKKMGK